MATPEPVAAVMAKWVMAPKPRTLLDPAAGLGGLLTACRQFDGRVQLVGVERDVETLKRAKTTAPSGAKLILADYLKSDAGLFDGIIANPPYVKAHRLDYSEKDWRYFEERFGTPLDRLTNLYALFLLKIWEDLAPSGHAAVILPAEFLNANFGHEIKDRLVRAIRPAALVVFAPALNLFAMRSRRAQSSFWTRAGRRKLRLGRSALIPSRRRRNSSANSVPEQSGAPATAAWT